MLASMRLSSSSPACRVRARASPSTCWRTAATIAWTTFRPISSIGLTHFLAQECHQRVAVSVDVRSGPTLSDLPGFGSRAAPPRHRSTRVVSRCQDRYAGQALLGDPPAAPAVGDTRTLPECIERERELLTDVSALGHHVDTSDLSPRALRVWVKDLSPLRRRADVAVPVLRFQARRPTRCRSGVRRTLPAQSALRSGAAALTGRDAPVIDFLSSDPTRTACSPISATTSTSGFPASSATTGVI